MENPANDEVYLERFLQNLLHIKQYSRLTIDHYERDIKQFYGFILKEYNLRQIQSVKLLHVRDWLAYLALNYLEANSLKRKKSSLSTYFKFLQKNGIIKSNVIKEIPIPSQAKKLPQFLDGKATNELLNHFFQIDFEIEDWKVINQKLIIATLYSSGIRRAELSHLKSSDIYWSNAQIKILGKGNKYRFVPLPEILMDLFKKYLAAKQEKFNEHSNTDNFFITHTGQPFYDNYIYRLVKEGLSSVTTIIKRSPHVLRHTFATELLNNGADISVIKDLLGHSSLAATQIYTHTNIENLKKIFKNSHPRN